MGKRGRQSRRGVGEKDELPRDKRLAVNVTQEDYALVLRASEKLKISKADVLIGLIRKHLSRFAQIKSVKSTKPRH